ncbi:hypothetical protein SAMN05444164_1231 [Bradyrhizobium erythrophlei]|uniref:Uncharacterized protein n=1 Tax=Bradyrhizobium erythrophlei TaxID=1437360 RepID=A0A1H4QFP9_9BRAD|nr:hypothetical protein [Bradyrhizobium erythrophlei]SEC18378.1 hypothetical protein SAMN05444164_1231 [Bradyrhizobium erythrophlei]
MRPTTAPAHNVIGFNRPIRTHQEGPHEYETPHDVVRDSRLSLTEKRAILASWASDASAVASNPILRAPRGLKSPVPVSDILEALRALDSGPPHPPGGRPARLRSVDRCLAA